MILFRKSADLHNWVETQHKKGKIIGFVPTMGALHPGHISLIEDSKKANDFTVCSIFVNPTQFNDKKDFDRYPITIEQDLELLLGVETDLVFIPAVDEIYPAGEKKEHFELGYLENILEGKYRPGHFQGVCMVVSRLLKIVGPDNFYLGQKDYQQCMVIKKLLELMNIQGKTNIIISPTLREKNGLAMSSRNMRLNEAEKTNAATIYQTLQFIKQNIRPGDLSELKRQAVEKLEMAGFNVDYVEIADAENLHTVTQWDGKQNLVALVAAFLSEVRLIDNLLLQ